MSKLVVFIIAVLLVLPAAGAAAGILWDNMASWDRDNGRSAACTDAPDSYWGGAYYAEVADDFVVPDGPGWRITEFHMVHHYFQTAPGDWFWVSFYRDNGRNMPEDDPFMVYHYLPGEFQEIDTGYKWGGMWVQWEAILPVDLVLPAGRYFVSGIPGVADLDYTYSPNSVPDPRSESNAWLRSAELYRPFPDTWTDPVSVYGDAKYMSFAFQLHGGLVPEPAVTGLLGLLVVGWGLRARTRR